MGNHDDDMECVWRWPRWPALVSAPAMAQTHMQIGFINSYSGFLAQPDEMDKGASRSM